MPKTKTAPPDPDQARAKLADIGERRRARPTKAEIDAACLAARAAGITVVEMEQLTGIQRQWIHKNHLPK